MRVLRPGSASNGNVRGVIGSVEGLRFTYAVHPLPAGRYGFRRWRFEVWHGATLVAAGWRVSERDATRAIERLASDRARRMFGLAGTARRTATNGFLTGATVRVDDGAVAFHLVPRALESTGAPALA
jgi:hypothetical protein